MFVRVGLGSFACVLSSALDLRPACLILLMCLCLCQVGAMGGGSGLAPPGASWHWTTLQTQEHGLGNQVPGPQGHRSF